MVKNRSKLYFKNSEIRYNFVFSKQYNIWDEKFERPDIYSLFNIM